MSKIKRDKQIFYEWQFWLVAVLCFAIFVSVIFCILICLNVFDGLEPDDKTAWITFLCSVATLGASLVVGIIAFWQNSRNEQRLFRQAELDKLKATKDKLYQNYIVFSQNDTLDKLIFKLSEKAVIAGNNGEIDINKILDNYDITLLSYSTLCELQANDIVSIKYNIEKLSELHSLLCKTIDNLDDMFNLDTIFLNNVIEATQNYMSVRDLYSIVIHNIDAEIIKLSDRKMSYREFWRIIEDMKDTHEQDQKIAENVMKLKNKQSKIER